MLHHLNSQQHDTLRQINLEGPRNSGRIGIE